MQATFNFNKSKNSIQKGLLKYLTIDKIVVVSLINRQYNAIVDQNKYGFDSESFANHLEIIVGLHNKISKHCTTGDYKYMNIEEQIALLKNELIDEP